ncbi:MAG: hypothetical protein FWD50_04800, partial [Betaproteobacteria bacterium]|nr:hypothetical protein [Betaproteobacteria bacterium]
ERARIIRARLDQQAPAARATTLEITASRQPGQGQSVRLINRADLPLAAPGAKAKAAVRKE